MTFHGSTTHLFLALYNVFHCLMDQFVYQFTD
jgi:hypothetical protein